VGGFASALGAVGNRMHEENLINWQANYAANQKMADTLEAMSKDARPEFAPKLQQAAFMFRTLPPQKSPPKGFDLHTLMVDHAKQALGSERGIEQKPQGEAKEVPSEAPQPTQQPAAQGQPLAQGGLPSPPQAAVAPTTPPWMGPPQGPAAQQAVGQAVDQGAKQQQTIAGAPPPVSGMASPGFSTPGTPPPAALQPPPTPQGFADEHGPGQFYTYTMPERMQMEAGFQGALTRAKAQAEAEGKLQLFMAERAENMKTMEAFRKQGFSHFKPGLSASGGMSMQPDLGYPIPGLMTGAEILAEDPEAMAGKATIDPQKLYRARGYADQTRDYVGQQVGRPKKATDPLSPTGFSWVWYDALGNELKRQPNAPAEGGAGTTETSSTREQRVTIAGPNGEQIIVKKPFSTSTKVTKTPRGLTALPAPPTAGAEAGAKTGGAHTPTFAPATKPRTATPAPSTGMPSGYLGHAPLSPAQREAGDKQLGAANRAAEIIKSIGDRLELLQSFVAAKKIQLVTDPDSGIIKPLIARNVPLSAEEAELAADLVEAPEHINTLRLPLGGGGFRSVQAWNALVSLAGNPMANPQVTKGVIKRTLESLASQRKAIALALEGKGKLANIEEAPGGARDVTGNRLAPPPSTTGTVKMRAPNGQERDIPSAEVEHYKAKGATVVQ